MTNYIARYLLVHIASVVASVSMLRWVFWRCGVRRRDVDAISRIIKGVDPCATGN